MSKERFVSYRKALVSARKRAKRTGPIAVIHDPIYGYYCIEKGFVLAAEKPWVIQVVEE